MKLVKKLLTGVAIAAAMASAQAVTVGGVTWDPNYVDAGDNDFLSEFQFTQWFSTTNSTVDNIQNYSAASSISTVLASLGGVGASGYYLQGVGEITRVNESNGIGTFTEAGKELTYAFGGIALNKDGTFNTSDAWARLHVNSTSPNYTTPASSQAEVDDAQTGSTWLDLAITSLGFDSGAVANGIVSASLSIVGGDAMGYFSPLQLSYTADAFFNTSTDAKYSSGGNGSVIGNTNDIPEPTSVALLGLGLVGLAAARRRKQAK